MSDRQGMVLVVSGPSGVGKGTVNAILKKRLPQIMNSVSLTTREPRPGEEHGKEYFFVTRADFEKKIADGQLLEWAEYVGNLYGTPRLFVQEKILEGKIVLLEIETAGGLQVMQSWLGSVSVFLAPPNFMDLKQRLIGRGQVDDEVLSKRLRQAQQEILLAEKYDYLVINDQVEIAADEIENIIQSEFRKTSRQQDKLINLREEAAATLA